MVTGSSFKSLQVVPVVTNDVPHQNECQVFNSLGEHCGHYNFKHTEHTFKAIGKGLLRESSY